ncbi:MAG TPA: hypothetical protein VFV79_01055 [Saprospiraceae bacterium]|nr:hypothetical protein [Saprospiraceae bacterium]
MKNLLLIALLFISALGYAQSNKEEVDLFQSLYGMDKKSLVAEFIKLQGAQKDEFWKLYDAYEVERKAIGKDRIKLLEKYASTYATMDETMMDDIMKSAMELSSNTDKLQASYYGKIKKSVGIKPAAQFLQLESYLSAAIRAAILEEIPFIGEMDK